MKTVQYVHADVTGVELTDKQYAAALVVDKWGMGQLEYFFKIVEKESNWKPTAQNPTSTAFGLMQFLDGTWGGTGYSKTENPHKQLEAGIIYIAQRYGTPEKAWEFHLRNNWY